MTAGKTTEPQPQNIPIRDGLLTSPLSSLEKVRLLGTKCLSCKEVSFGQVSSCPNCAEENVQTIALSSTGTLWTYTIIRNRPPGDYKGAEPYVPLCEGLIELPDGIRVLSPIECDLDKVEIGMTLYLDIFKLYTNSDGKNVIAFRFVPTKKDK